MIRPQAMSDSRIVRARRQAGTTKRAVATAAALSFVLALFLARETHPARAGGSSAARSGSASSQSDFDSSASGFGQGGIAPSSGGTPQVQTGVS